MSECFCRSSEFKLIPKSNHENFDPLVIKREDESIFRIDTVSVYYHDVLSRQFRKQSVIKLKFCLIPDEELETTDSEHWELVLFPMYDADREEINHATISEDSIVNGNLTIKDGEVVSLSSNYYEIGYREVQDPVTNFAAELVGKILENL